VIETNDGAGRPNEQTTGILVASWERVLVGSAFALLRVLRG